MTRPARMTPYRRVRLLARPGVTAARDIYQHGATDLLRVAALVEMAGAAAALARTIMRHRHLDVMVLREHVSDPVDVNAVLGRGAWLPTMVRHVPVPPTGPVPIGVVLPTVVDQIARRRTVRPVDTDQLALFPAATAGGER